MCGQTGDRAAAGAMTGGAFAGNFTEFFAKFLVVHSVESPGISGSEPPEFRSNFASVTALLISTCVSIEVASGALQKTCRVPARRQGQKFRRKFRLNFQKISRKISPELRRNFGNPRRVQRQKHRQAMRGDAGSRAEPEQVGGWDAAGFFQPCGHTPYLAGKTNE